MRNWEIRAGVRAAEAGFLPVSPTEGRWHVAQPPAFGRPASARRGPKADDSTPDGEVQWRRSGVLVGDQ